MWSFFITQKGSGKEQNYWGVIKKFTGFGKYVSLAVEGDIAMADNDYAWKTNAKKVTEDLTQEILKEIGPLKEMVDYLEKAVKKREPLDAIPYRWIENIESHFNSIRSNICRINGAVLVRGTLR